MWTLVRGAPLKGGQAPKTLEPCARVDRLGGKPLAAEGSSDVSLEVAVDASVGEARRRRAAARARGAEKNDADGCIDGRAAHAASRNDGATDVTRVQRKFTA